MRTHPLRVGQVTAHPNRVPRAESTYYIPVVRTESVFRVRAAVVKVLLLRCLKLRRHSWHQQIAVTPFPAWSKRGREPERVRDVRSTGTP